MSKWEKDSEEFCHYCGEELLVRTGRVVRYRKDGGPYHPYIYYQCPRFRWWKIFFQKHQSYMYVKERR